MNLLFYFVIAIFPVFSYCGALDSDQLAEQTLINSLLNGYNKNIRPAVTVSGSILLYFRQITSLDEKNQIMTSSSYFSQSWKDPRLTWDYNTNDGITQVFLPVTSLWIPDMFVLNTASASAGYLSVSTYSLAKVDYEGNVYMLLPCIGMQTRCKLNTKKFPFDTQTCTIVLSSWGRTKNRLDFDSSDSSIDKTGYISNPIWNLQSINVNVSSNTDRYPEDGPIEEFNFIFTLVRYPLYYMMTGIFPCFVLNVVTLLSYTLPFAQQIGLSMTTFLTFSVYSLRVSNDIPVQSEYLPYILIYFIFSVLNTLISMFWFILANHFISKTILPKFLIKFAGIIKKILFCIFEEEKKVSPTDEPKNSSPDNEASKEKDKVEILDEKNKKQHTSELDLKALEPVKENENRVSKLKNDPPKTPPTNIAGSNTVIDKCVKCGLCDKCKEEAQKDKDKKKNKDLIDSSVAALNYFAFGLMFLFIFITNLTLWLLIGT